MTTLISPISSVQIVKFDFFEIENIYLMIMRFKKKKKIFDVFLDLLLSLSLVFTEFNLMDVVIKQIESVYNFTVLCCFTVLELGFM